MRRSTGVKDSNGLTIREGDVLIWRAWEDHSPLLPDTEGELCYSMLPLSLTIHRERLCFRNGAFRFEGGGLFISYKELDKPQLNGYMVVGRK